MQTTIARSLNAPPVLLPRSSVAKGGVPVSDCVKIGTNKTMIPAPRPAPTFAMVDRLFLSVGCDVSEGIMPQYEMSFIV